MASTNGHSAEHQHESSVALNAGVSENENDLSGPIFNPPVYQQRYEFVRNVVRRLQPRKVVDMGCAECKLLRLIKFETCLGELIGVDIDHNPLRHNGRHLEPLTTDYIFRRSTPFSIKLMQGSIADPDSSLRDADLFICIEVIEHLEEAILDRVPLSVFGTMRPKVAVLSTPNADFNVLFPGFTGFRHPDHKFEWTRNEFATWCSRVADQYGYSVDIGGVGAPPINRVDLGHCSQVATFTLLSNDPPTHYNQFVNNYVAVFECSYPFDTNPLSNDEKLCREAEYYIRVLSRNRQQETEEAEVGVVSPGDGDVPRLETDPADTLYIQLEELMVFNPIRRLTSQVDSVRRALDAYSNYEVRREGSVSYVVVRNEEGEEEERGESEEEEGGESSEYRNGSTPEDWDA